MASVEQHETPSVALTFSSTADMFDTFKSTLAEEADSDEESFHLPMLDSDEDNKETSQMIETEDEILNRFDTGSPETDQKCDDSILIDKEEAEDRKDKEVAVPCSEKDSKSTKKNSENDLVNIPTSNVNNTKSDDAYSEGNSKKEVEVSETVNEEGVKVNELESDCTEKSKEDNLEDDKPTEKENTTGIEGITEKIEPSKEATDKTDATTQEALNTAKIDEKSSSLETKEGINNEEMEVTEPTPCDLEDKCDEKSIGEAMEVENDKIIDSHNETVCDKAVEAIETVPTAVIEKEVPSDINESERNDKEASICHEPKIDSGESEGNASTSDEPKNDSLECEDLLNISIIRDVDEDNAAAIAEHTNDLINSSEKSDNEEPEEDKADNDVDDSEMDQDDNVISSDKDMEFEEDENSSNFCDQETTTNDESTNDATTNKEFDNDSNSASKDTKESVTIISKSDGTATTDATRGTEASADKEPKEISDAKENQDDKKSEVASQNKRPLAEVADECSPKKIRLSEKLPTSEVVKALASFREFMQSKKVKDKLSRSDLEQFVLQKICEAIMHKHEIGDMHQTMKRQEQTIENLRKDVQQLTKQARDLDIVNKKLMTELRIQNSNKKPLVPLKITRSVGLQVKLNLGNEGNPRIRKSLQGVNNNVSTPRTPIQNTPAQRSRTTTPNNTPIRQGPSPRKTPQPQQQATTPILSQALQQNKQATPPATAAVKRNIVRPKPAESGKPANPGVIDLTDEDDKAAKLAQPSVGYKVITKSAPQSAQKNITLTQAKPVAGKNMNHTKTVSVGQVKTLTKSGTPNRTVKSLPQGVRLTPTQVKNGIALPTTVMTSNSGSTAQLMYVVQPSSMVTSVANGNQKTLLLNFQPSNGVLTSTLNGSAVSVISKPGNSLLKAIVPKKHPAPLPLPPPVATNLSLKPLLPKPVLSIRKTDTGIILQWRMPYNLDLYEGIASYQLFAYQESTSPPTTEMWRKVGDVKALALPMACTLTQFVDKNKYYFAVRSVDVHKRLGAFSDPEEISL